MDRVTEEGQFFDRADQNGLGIQIHLVIDERLKKPVGITSQPKKTDNLSEYSAYGSFWAVFLLSVKTENWE